MLVLQVYAGFSIYQGFHSVCLSKINMKKHLTCLLTVSHTKSFFLQYGVFLASIITLTVDDKILLVNFFAEIWDSGGILIELH